MTVTRPPRIAVVDDAEVQRRILSSLLGKAYDVVAFPSGEAFFHREGDVDLVLLDIDMTGMNGYEVCRRLRQTEATQELPVIFVSGHDTTPERVAAYEAGGDDFIVKPIAANEVLHKVGSVLEKRRELHSLASQSQEARRVAMVALTNIGELGTILEFMRHCAGATRPEHIADHLLTALGALGLHGAVQIRGREGTLERTSASASGALQTSVLESLRNMGRIFVFGSRGVVNFEHVSLLVTNLPVQDEEHLGRLRDHLALLAEGAESRLAAMSANARANQLQTGATDSLQMLRQVLSAAATRTLNARRQGQQLTMELLEQLGRMIEGLNVTEIQRETLQHMIVDGMESLASVNDEAAIADDQFARLVSILEGMARDARNPAPDKAVVR